MHVKIQVYKLNQFSELEHHYRKKMIGKTMSSSLSSYYVCLWCVLLLQKLAV